MNDPAEGALPVILAAGLGTRMKSGRPKVLHELCGRPMLAYVLDAAAGVTSRQPLVVYSLATAELTGLIEGADFALQETPLGTADALRAALAVAGPAREILVLAGDVPLVGSELLAEMLDLRRARNAAIALVAVRMDEPGSLGRVVRTDDGQVLRIVEAKEATDDERGIREINAGVYAFDASWLAGRIADVEAAPVSGEFYLPALVERISKKNKSIEILVTASLDGHPGLVRILADRAHLIRLTITLAAISLLLAAFLVLGLPAGAQDDEPVAIHDEHGTDLVPVHFLHRRGGGDGGRHGKDTGALALQQDGEGGVHGGNGPGATRK